MERTQDGTPRIHEYGFIGDTRTGALVSPAGSIDWMCWPRFDSEPIFGRLIDAERGGRFELTVVGARVVSRHYRNASAVLVTEWSGPLGEARLTEAMIMNTRIPAVVRVLECVRGQVEAHLCYAPRPGLPGRLAPAPFTLHTAPSLRLDASGTWEGELAAGERLSTLLSARRSSMTHHVAADLLGRTDRWWQRWCEEIHCGPRHRDVLIRS
ncbi:MAG TPA: trehalase-like domain-containing protein, partial [Acidothermaceae bacterium]|nr:trehalase-like domain-containing protein [Acidothermaceae bacterium]